MTFPVQEYKAAQAAEDAVNKTPDLVSDLVEQWLRAEIAFANAYSRMCLVADDVYFGDSTYAMSLARDKARQLAYARLALGRVNTVPQIAA